MEPNLVDTSRRPIGAGGLESGPLAFGCWRFTHADVGHAQRVLETAIDCGLTLVDTADVYGLDWGGSGFGANEELLGRVLAQAPHLRDQIVLATKGGIHPPVPYDSSPAWLRTACEDSLRRLQVDVIDLYQLHRCDFLAHPAEVADTLDALRVEGKIREVGVSNYSVQQHEALQVHLPVPIATTQPEFSALDLRPLRDGTFDLALRDGVTPLAYSPLAGGRLLTAAEDARSAGVPQELPAVLDELAARENVDRAAIAIAFVLAHPSRPVAIVGTQDPDRIRATVGALGVHLDRPDCYRIIQASDGAELP